MLIVSILSYRVLDPLALCSGLNILDSYIIDFPSPIVGFYFGAMCFDACCDLAKTIHNKWLR